MPFQLKFVLPSAACIFVTVSIGCNSSNATLNSEKYLPLLEEVHQIECDHLTKAGVTPADTSLSEFRSTALKQILINPNHVVLAHYEDLNHSLARMVDSLDDNQLHVYFETLRKVYSKPCK